MLPHHHQPFQFLSLDVLKTAPLALTAHFAAYDIVIRKNGFGLPAGSRLFLARAALDSGKLRQDAGKEPLRFFPW
jgi:hypothetical protein